MKCMKCGYISFDYNDECPRCGKDLSAEKAILGTSRFLPLPSPSDPPHGVVPPPKDLRVDDFEAPQTSSKADSLLLRLKEEMAPLISPTRETGTTEEAISEDLCLEIGRDEECEEGTEEATPNGKIPNLEGLASIVEEINQDDGESRLESLEEESSNGLAGSSKHSSGKGFSRS